jgi:uncharacterized membrane protein YvbJ
MLICNNCFSENADGTVRCHQCNMAGNFSYSVPEGHLQALTLVKKSPLQCTNCGSNEPGEGLTCVQCHFPTAAHRGQQAKTLHPREYNNLKTG